MKLTVKNQSLEPAANFSQKQYITDLYECEKTKYILENRRKWLNHEITQLLVNIPNFENSSYYKEYNKQKKKMTTEEYSKINKPYNNVKTFSEYFWRFVGVGIIISVIASIGIAFLPDYYVFFDGIKIGLKIDFLSAIIGAVASLIIILIKNSSYKRKKSKYDVESEKTRKIVRERDKSIYNAKKNEYNDYVSKTKAERAPIIEMYRAEKRQVKANIEKLETTLSELYSMRINGVLCLHPNYQGLIPVSIIYGYFDTGRCTQFQGHEGAYNLYEDEKVKGLIINKLDGIAQQLNKINGTMSYVASAIDSCNNRLSTLEDAGRRMEKSLGSLNNNVNSLNSNVSNRMGAIEANTANAAYYSEVSARCDVFNTVYNLYNG